MTKTAKSKKKQLVGRPSGPEKKPLNIYMRLERIDKLKTLAQKEQKTISIMVENALEKSYGI